MTKQILRTYFFDSSSGDKLYQTLEYVDGTTSCDCNGWCRRIAPDGSRSCKHTRSVEAGYGDRLAKSVVETSGKPFAVELKPRFEPPKKTKRAQEPELDRAFDFSIG